MDCSLRLDRDYGNFDKYRSYLRPLGISHARIQSGWARTEQKKGVSALNPFVIHFYDKRLSQHCLLDSLLLSLCA